MITQTIFFREAPFTREDLVSRDPHSDSDADLFSPVSCPIADRHDILTALVRQFAVWQSPVSERGGCPRVDFASIERPPVTRDLPLLQEFLSVLQQVFGADSIPAVMGHALLGFHFFEQRQFSEAAAAFEAAKRLQDRYEDLDENDMRIGLLLWLGDTYRALEMHEPAFREYYEACTLRAQVHCIGKCVALVSCMCVCVCFVWWMDHKAPSASEAKEELKEHAPHSCLYLTACVPSCAFAYVSSWHCGATVWFDKQDAGAAPAGAPRRSHVLHRVSGGTLPVQVWIDCH